MRRRATIGNLASFKIRDFLPFPVFRPARAQIEFHLGGEGDLGRPVPPGYGDERRRISVGARDQSELPVALPERLEGLQQGIASFIFADLLGAAVRAGPPEDLDKGLAPRP